MSKTATHSVLEKIFHFKEKLCSHVCAGCSVYSKILDALKAVKTMENDE